MTVAGKHIMRHRRKSMTCKDFATVIGTNQAQISDY